MRSILRTVSILSLLLLSPTNAQAGKHTQNKALFCYYQSWATYRPGDGEFEVYDIDPYLCTHLIYAYAGVDSDTYEIEIFDPWLEACGPWEQCYYGKFTGLKKYNPNLKTTLSIKDSEDYGFAKMLATPENRSAFIKSSIELIVEYGFDGLDLYWGEDHQPSVSLESNKDNFSMLLKEMREAFDEAELNGSTGDLGRLMITAAVSAQEETVKMAYDIPEISKYLDFINVRTFNYIDGSWEYTRHHSPLYALPEEEDPNHDFYGFNTNYSINYWLSEGALNNQVALSVAAFGRSYVLADAEDHGLYAPTSRPTPAGPYSGMAGFLSFNEFCEFMDPYNIVRNPHVVSPYAYEDINWIGYDDWESAEEKAQYVHDSGLAGAVVWAIDYDDFLGKCGAGPNPILHSLAQALYGGPDCVPEPQEVCPNNPTMLYDNLCDCTHYYTCEEQPDSEEWVFQEWKCPSCTAFNPPLQHCDWAVNVLGCGMGQKS